jgi:glycosyltransferase involved in cell wall biosynthesis
VKILIHSNGPHVSTGYGVQCALLAEHLRNAGHEVAISCTYGQQGATGSWRGIPLYPVGYEVNSNDVIHNHAMHWFDGDPSKGWIITILDVWCLVNPLLKEFNVAAWVPVDHFPVPQDVLKFFHRTDAVPVAMSEFGKRELLNAGLNPICIPLGVDTSRMKPTPEIEIDGNRVTARQLFDLPDDAFVVGMVAMNKGWARDRKGFNEAFRAFGAFWKKHPEAVLFMHSEKLGGAEGINLVELAQHAAIPEHAIVWVDQYAYRLGMSAEMLAAAYTAMDVLLAPSHGEGFCVPLIEAQACGTPVVASHFSAQPELIGAGYTVMGQPEWDPAQHASYIVPFIADIVAKLEEVYAQPRGRVVEAVEFAQRYDFTRLFDEQWRPFLAELEAPAEVLPLEREPIPERGGVAILVPVMRRPENVAPLVESWRDAGDVELYFVCDEGDREEIDAVHAAGLEPLLSNRGPSFAQKINSGLEQTSEPWVFVCGDDVRFHNGWLHEARKVSDRFDVIGTNDTTGQVKNPEVAAGRHADHFFVRRAYVEKYGACLDGPGVLAPEAYRHWYTDKEIVQLAKARGVFTPCLTSIVEHLHPGYDGNEAARDADPAYRVASEHGEQDRRTFLQRLPLIEMQRTTRAKV